MLQKKLFLFNTASRQKEEFVPVNNPVGLYCCGPTVYNYAHIGNLRTYVFEDVLKRTLKVFGYSVNHIVNITDVGHLTSDEDTGEDKMEKGAKREGKSVWDIAEHFTKTFMNDIALLNILPADKWPKATDHIPQMVAMVKTLEDKGFTYTTSDGIYFDTAKFPAYVNFARLEPEHLRAGERVDMGEKRSVTDFSLWKFSPKNEQRQMEWDSPWGRGFPGWHIECSAMSAAYLPLPLDIHCGGADHVRVHHTNEIAQTEAATGKTFVKHWLHGEFLVVDKGKMAKSGDSFVKLATVQEKGIHPLAYRLFCFTAHYRSPLSFSWESLQAAEQSLASLKKLVAGLKSNTMPAVPVDSAAADKLLEPFYTALADDLNMPRALAAVWDLVKDDAADVKARLAAVAEADKVLGLDLLIDQVRASQEAKLSDGTNVVFECDSVIPAGLAESLLRKLDGRKQARAQKNWAVADTIRKECTVAGVVIKDLPDGSASVQIPSSLLVNADVLSNFINS